MPDTRSSTKAARILLARICSLEAKREDLIAESNAVNLCIEEVTCEINDLKGETRAESMVIEYDTDNTQEITCQQNGFNRETRAESVETEYDTDDTLYMISPSPSVDENVVTNVNTY